MGNTQLGTDSNMIHTAAQPNMTTMQCDRVTCGGIGTKVVDGSDVLPSRGTTMMC